MANPLREAVKRRFYPFAESSGFLRAKSSHPHFTSFRRVRGDIAQVFDIQWDKYGRPSFVINFGEVCLNEPESSAAAVETQHCPALLRLIPDKGSPRWWRLRKPWLEALATGRLRHEPNDVVDQVITYFMEAETWWAEKVEGPHVRLQWRIR
ncbi:MAG: hypothetical protein Q8Q73_09710 [Stagnimonas sp.]|nr:hypothetical protein [Stagnimonas sp.]